MAVSHSSLPQSLLGFFYGELVVKILTETGSIAKTNVMLEEIGFNIGSRLVDYYLAEAKQSYANDYDRITGVIKGTLRSFIGTNVELTDWSPERLQVSVVIPDNCLSANIDIPDKYKTQEESLSYMNVLAGIIRGALDMTRVKCHCSFSRDTLLGSDYNVIRVVILQLIESEYKPDDECLQDRIRFEGISLVIS